MSPSPVIAWHARNEVLVRFDTHGGGLEPVESNRPVGFQLCDRAGRCAFADAAQRGADIVLDATTGPGAATGRYCWADSPICNLYDRELRSGGPPRGAVRDTDRACAPATGRGTVE